MRSRFIRRVGKWTLIIVAIVAGWMLGSMHASVPAQDMFETPADYAASSTTIVPGTAPPGRPARSSDDAFLWVPRGKTLEQWNIKHAKVVATVPLETPPTAVVLSGDGKTAYVAAGSSIALVDTDTNSVTNKLNVDAPVTALALTTGKSSALVIATGNTVKRINLADRSSQTVDAGAKVTQLVAGGELVFALLGDTQRIMNLNASDGRLNDTFWTLDAKPVAAAVDVANSRLLVACNDRNMRVLDATTGAVVTTMPIASGTSGVCLCAAKNTVFVAGANTVDVLHADDASHYSALKSISLPPGSHGPTIDADGQLLTIITEDGGKTTLCVFGRRE